MDDPSGDAPAGPDAGGGFTGFLSSLRGVIAAIATLVIAVSGLITALRATGVLNGDDEPTPLASTDERRSGLFRAVTRTKGDIYFEGDTMVVVAKRRDDPYLELAEGDTEYEDVSLSARIEGPDKDFGAGFVCRHRGGRTYYLLSIQSGGRFSIVRYRGGPGNALARGMSSAIRDSANDVIARCLDDRPTTLSLTVNGSTVARAEDEDGIERGSIGVRVGTKQPHAAIRFDDVVLR
jgi:hypothetical protein